MKKKLFAGLLACLAAGCAAAGLTACGEGNNEPTACEHDYTVQVVPSTCKEQGYTENICIKCNDTYRDLYTPVGEHTYNSDWIVLDPADCELGGTQQRTCSVCGEPDIKPTDPLGHDMQLNKGQAATCTEQGFEPYSECTRCHYSEDSIRTIDALEHDWEFDMNAQSHSGVCKREGCGETLEAEEHAWSDNVCVVCEHDAGGSRNIYMYPEENGYSVIGVLESFSDTELVIPATYNGRPVISIKGLYLNSENTSVPVTELSIPATVTTVKNIVCEDLERITVDSENPVFYSQGNCIIERESKRVIVGCKESVIPADGSVTEIGQNAFLDCKGLTEIVIPESIAKIGDSSFYGCTGLVSVVYRAKNAVIYDYDSDNVDYWTNITFSRAGTAGEGLVLTVGREVQSLPRLFYAYSSEVNLKEVVLEADGVLSSVKENAFNGVHNADLKVSVPDLASWCKIDFENELANPLYYNPVNANNSDRKLYVNGEFSTELNTTSAAQKIGSYAFYAYAYVTDFTIGSNVTEIGDYAFWGCVEIKKLTVFATNVSIVGNHVSNVNGMAFYSVAPETLTAPAQFLPYVARVNVKTVTVTGGGAIGADVFRGCENLQKATLTVSAIGDNAFSNCIALREVTIGNTLRTIGSAAFSGCIELPKIVLPDSELTGQVESIGEYAFSGCYKLASVTLPDSLRAIRSNTFSRCFALTKIRLPLQLQSIGDYAFEQCGLTEIELPSHLQKIGISAFQNCKLTRIVIPDSVTEIGYWAFYENKLTDAEFRSRCSWSQTTPGSDAEPVISTYDELTQDKAWAATMLNELKYTWRRIDE